MRRHAWAVGGILALALGARVLGLDWGLPQVYEEAYPFKRSWPMWGWQPGSSFDLNPHFFNYPTLYFYVQFLGQGLLFVLMRMFGAIDSVLDYRVLYALDKTPFYLMGRSLTVLFAVATVFTVYRLGTHVRGVGAGIAAAFLVAVNHVHIIKSQVIEVDVPLTFFLVTCVYYCVRILDDPSLRNYLLAGLLAGLATSTKYSGMLLPLCILLAHAVVIFRTQASAAATVASGTLARKARGRSGRRKRSPRSERSHGQDARGAAPSRGFGAFLGALVLSRSLLLAGLVSLMALVLTSPYIVLDHQNFWLGFNYERGHMQVGHFGQDDSSTILYYVRVLTDSLLGWPLAFVTLAGFVYFVIVRRDTWALVVSLFPVVYLTLISSFTMRAERYILPLMPLACVLATAVCIDVLRRMRAPVARRAGLALTAISILLALPSITSFASDLSRLRPDTRTLARRWIEANVPPGAYIASEAYGPEPVSVIELAALSHDVRERIDASGRDVPIYAMAPIPMLQVFPELMGVFYDFSLYDGLVDYVVISSSVWTRYRKDTQRFSQQNAFYDELEQSWELAQQFGQDDGSGPRLKIYKNPKQSVTFSQRKNVEPIETKIVGAPEIARSIGSFYQRQGLNYESYGFVGAALVSYHMALEYPVPLANFRRDVTLGILRCYQKLGRKDHALRIVQAARASANNAAETRFWDSVRAQLEATP